MDHQRRLVFEEMRKQLAEAVGVETHIAAIGFAHDLQRIGRGQSTRLQPRPKCRDDSGLYRQRMNQDLLDLARRGGALFGPAKIERAFYAESTHDLDVGIRQMAKMIGAKNLPPAHRAAVGRRIAADIAEIAGPLEFQMADWKI